ncbi:MAG: hypothetical protein DRJ03_29860, partial [Chloroflexi bacterium]
MEQLEITEQPEVEAEEQEATPGQQDTQPSEPSPELEPLTPPEPEGGYRFKEGDPIIARYQVVSPLGFGGFSQVYHCKHTEIDREVAIKVLIKKKEGLQEAKAAGRLNHAHIIQVYDVLPLEDDTPVIIFDYVAGKTLEKALDQAQYRRLPLDADTLRIIHQVAEALDYAHSQNVIHRDVKPSNIILDEQGKAYLTDFGLAETKGATEIKRSALTVSAINLGGTVPYMSPERLKDGRPGDERSDIYSLGLVAYEMLTGQLPYRGRTGSLIAQIVTGDPFPPTKANPDLPLGVESVLLRAINRDPDKRPSSCLAFASALEETARAYVDANAQYSQAKEIFDKKRWRQALEAFEKLEAQAKGFKDTTHYLEQTRSQVRLLELYEQAQGLLKQGEYQAALDTLNNLTQLDPEYDVADLRQQARENLAREMKETLDAQYRQAVRQFKNEEYEACLDTLAVIYAQDADYSDPDGIVEPARAQAKRQQRLRELYNRGVKQMGQEQWEGAIATFQELQEEEPNYEEDVENQLASARLLAKVSLPLQEAKKLLKQEKFIACVDKLEGLRQIDADYKRDEVERLRQEALNLLYRQATGLLEKREFKDGLVALAALKQRSPDYPEVEELEAQAREGIRIQDLRAKLDELYQQAVEYLNQREYAKALELWQKIQQQQEDLEYPDQWNVEERAKEGLCMRLYNQALAALTKEDFDQALELWQQVRAADPAYPDSQQIEQQARVMQFYNQALDALSQRNPHQALELLRQAREANPNHSDKQRVEQQAQAMTLYSQAQEALSQGEARQALELLSQTRQVDPNYPDSQQIEQRAQAMNLYGQASDAFTQEEYRQALELLQQVRTIDPHYPDKHQVEQQAQAVIEERERTEKLRRWGLYLGGGAAALICLAIIIVLAAGGLPWVRPTPTATPTLTPSPSPTPTT